MRPDGKFRCRLNDFQAAIDAMELANNIIEGLKKFIPNPHVTVSVTDINSLGYM